jgi:O-antigen/teichoic acid export membrane protein
VESVLVGALRAHERYGPSVQISVLSRAAVVVTACVLVARGHGVVGIMVGTLCIVMASTAFQVAAVYAIIGRISLVPSLNREALAEVGGFGCFSWLQAVAGCIFSQADRLLIGVVLGTSAVGYYSVCVQATQPIHLAPECHSCHLSMRAAGPL